MIRALLRLCCIVPLAVVLAAVSDPQPIAAQAPAAGRPDFSGFWTHPGEPNGRGGATVFDRRSVPAWSPPNFEVAMEVDSVGVVSHVLKTLGAAAGEI